MPPESSVELSISTPLPAGLQLRLATLEDSAAVGRLIESVILGIGYDIDDEGERPDWEALLRGYLDTADSRFWVIDAQESGILDAILGTVGIQRFDAETAELCRLYLDSEQRGLGLGRRLMQQAMAEARQLGYRRMVLETHSALTPCCRLYESLGFTTMQPYTGYPLRYADVAYEIVL